VWWGCEKFGCGVETAADDAAGSLGEPGATTQQRTVGGGRSAERRGVVMAQAMPASRRSRFLFGVAASDCDDVTVSRRRRTMGRAVIWSLAGLAASHIQKPEHR